MFVALAVVVAFTEVIAFTVVVIFTVIVSVIVTVIVDVVVVKVEVIIVRLHCINTIINNSDDFQLMIISIILYKQHQNSVYFYLYNNMIFADFI